MSDKYTLPDPATPGASGAAAAAAATGGMAPSQTPKAASAQLTMHIKVYSPFKVYFDEEGYNLTAANATGPFDILPHHHNFMTLLSACDLIIRSVRGEQKIRISGGLMHVKADKVIVFLDI